MGRVMVESFAGHCNTFSIAGLKGWRRERDEVRTSEPLHRTVVPGVVTNAATHAGKHTPQRLGCGVRGIRDRQADVIASAAVNDGGQSNSTKLCLITEGLTD